MRREGEEEGVRAPTETTGSLSAEQRREHDTVIQGSTKLHCYCKHSVLCIGRDLLGTLRYKIGLLPRVRITKLHCYCKHCVLCIG